MKALLKPKFHQLVDAHLDVTNPDAPIEIKVSDKGVVWVNVGPVCLLRICRTGEVTIIDERKQPERVVIELTDEEFKLKTDEYVAAGFPDLAPCCKKEDRGIDGWCKSCGDPCF